MPRWNLILIGRLFRVETLKKHQIYINFSGPASRHVNEYADDLIKGPHFVAGSGFWDDLLKRGQNRSITFRLIYFISFRSLLLPASLCSAMKVNQSISVNRGPPTQRLRFFFASSTHKKNFLTSTVAGCPWKHNIVIQKKVVIDIASRSINLKLISGAGGRRRRKVPPSIGTQRNRRQPAFDIDRLTVDEERQKKSWMKNDRKIIRFCSGSLVHVEVERLFMSLNVISRIFYKVKSTSLTWKRLATASEKLCHKEELPFTEKKLPAFVPGTISDDDSCSKFN